MCRIIIHIRAGGGSVFINKVGHRDTVGIRGDNHEIGTRPTYVINMDRSTTTTATITFSLSPANRIVGDINTIGEGLLFIHKLDRFEQ